MKEEAPQKPDVRPGLADVELVYGMSSLGETQMEFKISFSMSIHKCLSIRS